METLEGVLQASTGHHGEVEPADNPFSGFPSVIHFLSHSCFLGSTHKCVELTASLGVLPQEKEKQSSLEFFGKVYVVTFAWNFNLCTLFEEQSRFDFFTQTEICPGEL